MISEERQKCKGVNQMRRKVSLFINIFIFSAVPVSWYYMFLHHGGLLGALGFGSLRYFTVLSNILMGAASLIWVLAALFVLKYIFL